MTTFGQRFRELRIEHGYSQAEMAARISADLEGLADCGDYLPANIQYYLIDAPTLSKVENGRLPPPTDGSEGAWADALYDDVDEVPFELYGELHRLAQQPFEPAPPIDPSMTILCSRTDDLETWQAKLAAWNAAVTR